MLPIRFLVLKLFYKVPFCIITDLQIDLLCTCKEDRLFHLKNRGCLGTAEEPCTGGWAGLS